ncbi:tyrosine-type recombinase/integrase [Roseovarius nanhaiticus]|uniref:tyrosine-type recombinase/integrase n=1 Tax=Roseovarius nanhaiticus TaxID=573024 RepID=UPI0024929D22|nr:tyrosine-type recombinase/integrase [Roseovarius nanhaiticus]
MKQSWWALPESLETTMTSSKKRPTKPKIARERLKWVWPRTGGEWIPYHRITWTDAAGKRKERAIKLNWCGDAKTLDDEYWAAESGRHHKQVKEAKHTWATCIMEWRADARIQKKLAEGTKKSYNREFEKILEKNADKSMSATTRQAIRKKHIAMAETPRAADWMLQSVSILWNFAKDQLDWPLGDNPTARVEKYGTQKEFRTWPDWMLDALDDAPQVVRIACGLILGTGQRPSAAIAMPRIAFHGEWVTVIDEKGDSSFPIYCPESLRSLIDGLESGSRHVLPKSDTSPLSYSSVEKAFRAWRENLDELGAVHDDNARHYSLHGLRKRACVELAEAGCSDAQIQSVTGQSPETVAKYRKEANRRKMSRAAQMKRSS